MSKEKSANGVRVQRLVSLPGLLLSEIAFRVKRATTQPKTCQDCIYWHGNKDKLAAACGKHLSVVPWYWKGCGNGIWKRKANDKLSERLGGKANDE